MIFLTTGTQLPFDRLVAAVDCWAADSKTRIIAQIGNGSYIPSHMEHYDFLPAQRFEEIMCEASCIISHAGMGTIISSMTYGKPAILMARQASLGEHRNNHQVATVRKFQNHPQFRIIESHQDIAAAIESLVDHRNEKSVAPYADEKLVTALKSLINN